jgi:hypothetical protein
MSIGAIGYILFAAAIVYPVYKSWRNARAIECTQRDLLALLAELAADREIADNLDI